MKVVIELALEYEKEVGPCKETIIVCESKKMKVLKLVNWLSNKLRRRVVRKIAKLKLYH